MGYTVTSSLAFLQNDSISTQFDVDNTRDVKIQLMKIINAIIERNSLSQEEAARVLGTGQSKISYIKHLKTHGFAFERIFLFLFRLSCDMELAITLQEERTTIKIQSNIKDLKIAIMCFIIRIITKYYLSQAEAAKAMNTDQPKVSNISRLKTDNFAIEYLLTLLARLGCTVEIIIREKQKKD